MTGNIFWLASYPKSGNTWFRIFLSAIRGENISEPDINDLDRTPIASARELFDETAGLESSDLTADEIDELRPDIYRQLSDEVESPLFMKIHDACLKNKSNEWLFPPEATKGVLYIVRNPLDVAVSYANHNANTIDKVVDHLCQRDFSIALSTTGMNKQLQQRLLDWSGHVRSWLESPHSVCLIRYEDMKNRPLETFRRAVDFLELDKTNEQVGLALDACRIDKLQQQEARNRFHETPQSCQRFFRKGIVGDWREHLSPEQVDKLLNAHRDVMKQLGYLDEQDRLTV